MVIGRGRQGDAYNKNGSAIKKLSHDVRSEWLRAS